MKLERSKNAIRNIKTGLISKLLNVLFPFVLRTVFIRTIGVEYLGLNSLFSSVLTVLSLAELGFGSAVVFHMYRAIAEDDNQKINALLSYYKKIYWCVGSAICVIGVMLIPFLPKLINGNCPADIDPIVIYLLYLINTVLSYFIAAYKGALLSAYQRNDVRAKINIAVQIGMNLVQIVVLLVMKNYYVYLVIMPFFTIVSNLCVAAAAQRMFPQHKPVGQLDIAVKTDIRSKVSSLILEKVCMVSRNSFDTIFISMFLGLKEIAVYNNYYYIMKSISELMSLTTNSITAGVGNSMNSESEDKNHNDMMRMYFIYMWISGWCCICLLCLFQPFMTWWMGKDMLFSFSGVLLLCIYFYLLKLGDLRAVYRDAAGLWTPQRVATVTELFMNIILNYSLGRLLGVNGILLATNISMVTVNFCWKTRIVYRYCFPHHQTCGFFLFHLKSACVTAGIACLTFLICNTFPEGFLFFCIRMLVCIVFPNILYYLLYRNTHAFKDAVPWMMQRVFKYKIEKDRK